MSYIIIYCISKISSISRGGLVRQKRKKRMQKRCQQKKNPPPKFCPRSPLQILPGSWTVVVHGLQFLEKFSREYKLVLLLNLNNSGQMVSIVVVHGHFFKKSTEHIKLSNGSLLAFSINSFRLFYWYFEDKKLSV